MLLHITQMDLSCQLRPTRQSWSTSATKLVSEIGIAERKPNDAERYIYMGEGKYSIPLESCFRLDFILILMTSF